MSTEPVTPGQEKDQDLSSPSDLRFHQEEVVAHRHREDLQDHPDREDLVDLRDTGDC